MTNNINVTCVIDSLGSGGAERILTILADGLNNRGYKVTILTFVDSNSDYYAVPMGVVRKVASREASMSCRWFNLKCQRERIKTLQESIIKTSPDIVISFMDLTIIKVIVALAGKNIPVLASEHTDPRYHDIGWKWENLRRLAYPFAAKIVMLTEETRHWAEKFWPKWDLTAIPNPVLPPTISDRLQKPIWFNKKNLVAMGRLTHVKGFDMLIKTFSIIAPRFPDWNLTILGEGDLRRELEEQVKKADLEERVILPGNVNPPFDILKQADIFVMSSRYEGFPNAICEAMACGIPVVSFDCPSGPRAIIRDNIDGLLAPEQDINALAEKLMSLMINEEKRNEFASRAPEVLERFSFQKYLDSWENLITEALKRGVKK